MAGVQYFGSESVVKAYLQREVGSFAVFQGKEMIFAHVCEDCEEGKEKLLEFVTGLWKGTTAVYSLKIYRDVETITKTSQDCGSFNFKLHEWEGSGNGSGNDNLILSKLAALEARLNDEEEGEEENEPADQWDKIGALLEKPVVIAGINKLFGIDISQPAKVGAIPPTDENEKLITQAVAILKTKDPNLGNHLMKLAGIAESKPANFKFLLQTLESM